MGRSRIDFYLLEVVLSSLLGPPRRRGRDGEKGKGRKVSGRCPEAAGPCPWSDRNFCWAVEMPQWFPPGFSQCFQSSRMAELMRGWAGGRSQDLGSLGEEL